MSSPPTIDAQKWRARAASWRVWLCELLVWVVAHLGESRIARAVRISVRRELNDAQRTLRSIIVLLALSRARWIDAPGPGTRRPGAFMHTRSSADLRHCGRIVRFRAMTLNAKILRLRAVIDDLDTHVARMVSRLEAGFRQLGPVLITMLALAASLATTDAALADSS